MFKIKMLITALCCICLTSLAQADGHSAITFDDLRIRAVHGGMKVTAGFVTITNSAATHDRLLRISTDFAGKSELHTMSMDNGVMKMRPLADGIIIPAGESITLKPGGLHLMFMKLEEEPQMGERRDITFFFENAGEITLAADVRMIKHSH